MQPFSSNADSPAGNLVSPLQNFNFYTSDQVLREAIAASDAAGQDDALAALGAVVGSEQVLEWARLADQHPPELSTHDSVGNRIDRVEFHPAWHALLALLRKNGMQAGAWMQPGPGAHVARAAAYFLHGQAESGSLCPTTMTFASIPVLQKEPALFDLLRDKLACDEHDMRDLPLAQKKSILIGMGMTEKQGGSDVRSNTTVASPAGPEGRGQTYFLTGHKWFFSAPMCDAHLVLARTTRGLSCFFVPRWHPDGSKNAVLIQRLKDKLGNRSNSSSEVEFHDALGIMVGEEGRGIPAIIDMASITRIDCVIGSAALMRQSFVQAAHYASQRSAFGRRLAEQPLMRNVLADLALESEAATRLMLRLASALDRSDTPLERAWRRVMTPAAKFWICKRAIEFTAECMEVWGGNGYVETGPMARMYREAPVNSIWEGSGNVMCLDVLRAVEREAEGFQLLLTDLERRSASHDALLPFVQRLSSMMETKPMNRESMARRFTQDLVLAVQADLMLDAAPQDIAQAFVASRLDAGHGRVYGTLDHGQSAERILARAWPTSAS